MTKELSETLEQRALRLPMKWRQRQAPVAKRGWYMQAGWQNEGRRTVDYAFHGCIHKDQVCEGHPLVKGLSESLKPESAVDVPTHIIIHYLTM